MKNAIEITEIGVHMIYRAHADWRLLLQILFIFFFFSILNGDQL